MLLQRHASKACARKMLALSRPKIAVTVSIIVVVHTPRSQGTVRGLHSQNDSGASTGFGVRVVIPCNSGRGGWRGVERREVEKNDGSVTECGSPGRIRTSDQPVNSRLLYH